MTKPVEGIKFVGKNGAERIFPPEHATNFSYVH